jgi:hypothetical protein
VSDKEKHTASVDEIYLIKMCDVCEKLTKFVAKRKSGFVYIICEKCGKEE